MKFLIKKIIRFYWCKLYDKVKKGKITTKEYAIRRRSYENIINKLNK